MSQSDFFMPGMEKLPVKQPVRVMLVDDHEIWRQGVCNIINTTGGFTIVAEASTCQDALARFDSIAIDLVFLDLLLPDGNGMELVRLLRQHSTPPSIIVLSAKLNDDLLLEAMFAGASGYLTKDIPATEIARLLKGFSRGDLVLTSPIASRLIHLLIAQCHVRESGRVAENNEVSVSTPRDWRAQDPAPADLLQEGEASPLSLLTAQEDKIFQLMRQGLSNKQIASQISISRFTVGKHIQNILRKLGVTNRTQAASYTSFEGGKTTFNTNKFGK